MAENQNQDITIVTKEDFAATDLEAPIRGSNKVDCWSLANLYQTAANQHEQADSEAAARVFHLIANIARMDFKPEDRAEPYGPMFVVLNGTRSMIPCDLRGDQSDVLAVVAAGVDNPGLRARLSDVAWHNNRSLSAMAQLAVNAYCDVVQAVLEGTAEFLSDERTASSRAGTEMLYRACQIAKATGWKELERARLKSLVSDVTRNAFNSKDHRGFLNTAELGLQFRIGEPASIARDAEMLVATDGPDAFTSRELWQLTAHAHRQSENDAESDRCLVSAAECLVALAGAEGGRGMVAAGHLMDAIEALRQIPNTQERRQQLDPLLRDAQASIHDEMGVISTPFDLTGLVKETRESVGGLSLAQALEVFATLDSSPNPAELRDEAIEQAEENPLSSLIPMSIVDNEGKVVSKSPALTGNEEEDEPAIHHLIARNEGLRRQLVAFGQIDPARRLIHIEHPLGQRDFLPLVTMSPFVPANRAYLFSLAFMRFFGGDFISALHILVPQLENSLRHVLKQAGKKPSSIRSDMIQEDRNLSVLLKKDRELLEEIFGSAIIYEIENLFDFRGGPALRHELAHGLVSGEACYGPDAIYACWFIFRLCCLPVLNNWKQLAEWMDGNY